MKSKKSKMPNQSKKSSGGAKKGANAKTNTGACTGLKVENGVRSDVLAAPSHDNPYPNGLS